MLTRKKPMKPGKGFKAKAQQPRPVKIFEVHTPRAPAQRLLSVPAAPAANASVFRPMPKRGVVRCKPLREAYRLIPCQFDGHGPGGICGKEDGTVACCHSNWGDHGKALAHRADDSRAASGCFDCHRELDQGKRYSEAEKRGRFLRAHARTVPLLVAGGHWPKRIPVPDIETEELA